MSLSFGEDPLQQHDEPVAVSHWILGTRVQLWGEFHESLSCLLQFLFVVPKLQVVHYAYPIVYLGLPKRTALANLLRLLDVLFQIHFGDD